MRLSALDQAIAATEIVHDDLIDERVALEERVVRLRPASLDPDFLEERAAIVLGFYRPEEQIILYSH